jgi:hypothetical protein
MNLTGINEFLLPGVFGGSWCFRLEHSRLKALTVVLVRDHVGREKRFDPFSHRCAKLRDLPVTEELS